MKHIHSKYFMLLPEGLQKNYINSIEAIQLNTIDGLIVDSSKSFIVKKWNKQSYKQFTDLLLEIK